MNDFETALRDSLDRSVEPDAHRMMSDVRRGARRRRNRRRAVVAGAAAAVVVAGSFGASQFLTEDAPEPADQSGATSPTHVRTLTPSAEGLMVASYEPDCECHVLWRRDAEEWEQLHTIHDQFGQLVMGPDGVNGVLTSVGPTIEVTHDAGTTWSPVHVRGRDADRLDGGSEWYAWLGQTGMWVIDSEPSPWRVARAWHGPADGESVSPFELPDFEVRALSELGDTIVAIRRDRPNATTPVVSEDGGRTWQEGTWPCRTDDAPGFVIDGGVAFASCQTGSDAVVHRSLDLRSWQPWQRHADPFRIWQLDAERYWAMTPEGTLIVSGEDVARADLPVDATTIDAVTDAIDGRHYLAASDTIYESTDGGRTWQELED